MDQLYTLDRGVSYAAGSVSSKKSNTTKGSDEGIDMATYTTGMAEVQFRNTEAEIIPSKEDSPKKKKCCSLRTILSLIALVVAIGSVAALIILGLKYFPKFNFDPEEKCPVFVIADKSESKYNIRCAPTAEALQRVRHVTITSQRRRFAGPKPLTLNNRTVIGFWTFETTSDMRSVNITHNSSMVTCNDEGNYTFEYLDAGRKVVMRQNVVLSVEGSLSAPELMITPHYAINGILKEVYVECAMNTGCRHGTLVPEIIQDNNDINFINKATCSYNFTASTGGIVRCATFIEEALWRNSAKVACRLKPTPLENIPSSIEKETSLKDLNDVCQFTLLPLRGVGLLNCKKRRKTNGIASTITLLKSGKFVNGKTKILDVQEGYTKQESRITVASKILRSSDTISVNITFSQAHCTDEGNYTLMFSDDNSEIAMEVKIGGILPDCISNRKYILGEPGDTSLTCSKCPTHSTENVTVRQYKNATLNDGVLSGGTVQPGFPIDVSIENKNSSRVLGSNASAIVTRDHGYITVELKRPDKGCTYDELYAFEYTNGADSTKEYVNVIIEVPGDLYEQEEWKGPFIKDNKYEAKVEVFMGCSPQNVIIRRDNVQMGSDVITLNEQSAKVAKLTWDFNPVTSDDDGRTLTSHVEFTPYGSNTKREFKENIYVEVFDNSLCDEYPGCQRRHPTEPNRFISCSKAKTIVNIGECQTGLVFNEDSCTGKCDYP